MSGYGIRLVDIEHWSADAVEEVFQSIVKIATASSRSSAKLKNLSVFSSWGGLTDQEAFTKTHTLATSLDVHSQKAAIICQACSKAVPEIRVIKNMLAAVHKEVDTYNLTLDEYSNTVEVVTPSVTFDHQTQEEVCHQVQEQIRIILQLAYLVDQELALAIGVAEGLIDVQQAQKIAHMISEATEKAMHIFAIHASDVKGVLIGQVVYQPMKQLQNLAELELRNMALKEAGIDVAAFGSLDKAAQREILESPKFTAALSKVFEEEGLAGKIIKGCGPLGQIFATSIGIINDIHAGMDPTEAVATETVGTLTAIGIGAIVGGWLGGVGGSVFPGAGTVIGAIVGTTLGVEAAKGLQALWNWAK